MTPLVAPSKSSLFDIQVNGFAGVDFQQRELGVADVERAVAALAAHETLRFFVTFITDSMEALLAKLHNFEGLRKSSPSIAEAVCGYHLEGPWLCPAPGYCGAHDPNWMRSPDWDDFRRLQDAANGRVALVTLAPELPGSPPFIQSLVAGGVQVSLGHTNAGPLEIENAIAAGARFCTHLGNGVPGDLPRHDNVIQRLLARDELFAFFIPDGIHLPPYALKNFFRAKAPGKAFFTTDCVSAAGAPPGEYQLGEHQINVDENGVVRRTGQTNFAGSSLTPEKGVRNIEQWLGLAPDQARPLFSTAVAEQFGIDLPLLE